MTHSFVIADSFAPTDRAKRVFYELSIFLSGIFLVVLSAQIKIFLPFSSVPFTLQTLVVLLVGALLGTKRGVAIVSSYITAGFLGAPFFAAPMLLTSGYIFGFIASIIIVGKIAKKGEYSSFLSSLKMMLLGNLVIYFCGVIWLSFFIGIKGAIFTGVIPFIAFDMLKIVIASSTLPSLRKIIK